MTDRPRGAPGPLFIGSALLVLVSLDVVAGGPLSRLDVRLSRWTRTSGLARERWLDVLTYPGNHLAAGLVVGAAVAGLAWRARTVVPLVRLAVLGVITALAVTELKVAFHRQSPADSYGWGYGVFRSYPSGHTATAIVLWGLLATLAARYATSDRTRRLTRVLGLALPAGTMVGMLARDYHWLSDVVAAAGLGVVLLQVERLVLAHWPRARRGSADRRGGTAARRLPARPGRG